MIKKVKVTEVTDRDYCPSNFYIVNAMGNYVFFHTKSREEAQAAADEIYGKNFYIVRSVDLSAKVKTKRQLLEDIDKAKKQEEEV